MPKIQFMRLKSFLYKLRFFGFLFLLTSIYNKAQSQDTSKTHLPFVISALKKLPADELEHKKTGTYVTGVPDISVDPINGFGYGIEGSLIFNGKRNNPFFEYTPYMTKLDVALFNTSRNQREIKITLDKPYLFQTKWRIRGEVAYEINPNLLFFGVDPSSFKTLSQLSKSDGVPNTPFTGKTYRQYTQSLGDIYALYNTYTKQESIFNLSGEYSLMDSKMRVLVGGEYAGVNITPGDTASRLIHEKNSEKLLGIGRSKIAFLQLGVVYDTRDFEPDPNQGIFAEVTNEFSSKYLGSDYNMDKLFGQFKIFRRLVPEDKGKIIAAARLGVGYTFGNSPFFEYQDEWSSEGSIEGLGGAHTIRGYKQSRFLDRGLYFFNAEIRARFLRFPLLKQHLAFSAVPFFDAGGGYHSVQTLTSFQNLRYSEGMGLRIAWNLSTILRFDYAISKEDKQFFFIFSQAF